MTTKLLIFCCFVALVARSFGQEPLTVVFLPNAALAGLNTNVAARTALCSSLALLCDGSTNKVPSLPDTNNWLVCSYLSVTGRAFAVTDRQTCGRMNTPAVSVAWQTFLLQRGGMIWTNQNLWFDPGLVPDWASATNPASKK